MAVPCDMTIQLLGGCEAIPTPPPLGRSTYFNGSKVVVLLFFLLVSVSSKHLLELSVLQCTTVLLCTSD